MDDRELLELAALAVGIEPMWITPKNAYGEWDDAPEGAQEVFEQDGAKATRRAIVRAAAEIGRQMEAAKAGGA